MIIELYSFFAGAGFLDLGFETEGYKIVYVNELYQPFLNAYKHSRTKLGISEPEYGYYPGSITDLFCDKNASLLEDLLLKSRNKGRIVGFIGGPPCPDFSIGGKNRGRDGDQGKLSLSYIELIARQRPDFFLLENVKGLWKTKRHRQFYEELKEHLTHADYIMADHLINTIEYSVPQDRYRIFLFGMSKNLAADISQDLKIREDDYFPWEQYARYPGESAFQFPWPKSSPFREDSYLVKPKDIPEELTVQYWFDINDVANHPNAQHYFKPRAGLHRFISINEGDASRKSFKRLHRWRYSPTACYGNNEVHLHPYKPRRLTAAEALSIQSLPKEYELPDYMSLTDMFEAIGNGVPFLAAKMVASTIRSFLGGDICE